MITIKVWLRAVALGAAAGPLLASATLATEATRPKASACLAPARHVIRSSPTAA